jgi:hypothetical protein
VIGRRKDLDKSRKQVQSDLDVDPRSVIEGCQGIGSRGRWDGMTEAGYERSGSVWSVFLFAPSLCLLAPPPSLSFAVAFFLSFLVSDLLSNLFVVYFIAQHTCHTIPILLINSRVPAPSLQYILFFCFLLSLFFFHSCLYHTWMKHRYDGR